MTPTIRPLTADDAPACDAVILSLPYFFGDPAGVRDCANAVRSQGGGFVAMADDGSVTGFITLQSHFAGSAEITWMAVHADHRRSGIGRQLIDAAVRQCAADGVQTLFVLTLGPSVPEDAADNYEGTRRFYRSMGFGPLRELGLREWNNSHAPMLARPVTAD